MTLTLTLSLAKYLTSEILDACADSPIVINFASGEFRATPGFLMKSSRALSRENGNTHAAPLCNHTLCIFFFCRRAREREGAGELFGLQAQWTGPSPTKRLQDQGKHFVDRIQERWLGQLCRIWGPRSRFLCLWYGANLTDFCVMTQRINGK